MACFLASPLHCFPSYNEPSIPSSTPSIMSCCMSKLCVFHINTSQSSQENKVIPTISKSGPILQKKIQLDEFTNSCWMLQCVEISVYSLWPEVCLFNDIPARWRNLPVTARGNNRAVKKKRPDAYLLYGERGIFQQVQLTNPHTLQRSKSNGALKTAIWSVWTCQIQFKEDCTARLTPLIWDTSSLLTIPVSFSVWSTAFIHLVFFSGTHLNRKLVIKLLKRTSLCFN